MGKKLVAVVIPVYKKDLSFEEIGSLDRCCNILKNYPIILASPEGLDIAFYKKQYPDLKQETFPASYFENIRGYNRLMLSASFYERFLNYEFILIYQLDAFVFKDELKYWCSEDYDYIGAPWIESHTFRKRKSIIRSYIKQKWAYKLNRLDESGDFPHSLQFQNQVGNGGFSLRRVSKFYEICNQMNSTIQYYNSKNDSKYYNEDVFWSLEVNRKKKQLRIPPCSKAIYFAFEQQPDFAFKHTKKKLPFGCHAQNLFSFFWKPLFSEQGYKYFNNEGES